MILDLHTPRVVTARGLARALGRAFDARHGLRRDFARAHGLSASEVSRVTGRGDRRGDSMPLRRVAALHGYQPHPDMDGHYRRTEAQPEPTVPEPDEDEEMAQLARDLAAEQEDDASDPMFSDLLYDARFERFLQDDIDELMWQRAQLLALTPDDHEYIARQALEDGDGATA